MKFSIKFFALTALSTMSMVAAAGKAGGFMELGLGMSNQTCVICSSVSAGVGGRIAGGYRFNDYVGLEAGFAGGSNSSKYADGFGGTVDGDENTNTFYGAVVGYYPFTKEFEVLARVGYGSTKTTTTIADTDFKSRSVSDIVWGVGLGYTPRGGTVGFRLNYDHLSNDESNVAEGGVVGPNGLDLISASFVVRF